eukprot:Gregarina_sp_Poly_1__4902@NODE_25_length_19863_cov_179_262730_g23_i0_p6_GENE_NODE_25_length_19863_cov_179_262730_g23_i0NODE_25_length_19863_cov_179_262730_g23_i0_p6_ORF_typecomplete_len442_score51_21zfRING_2/PF13639_6/1_8e15zfANAPC11/PF12861_7/5e08zfrbx1/PF12678_7/9_4e03zfrbx1/PF12678_7/5e07zfC3HC4_2/PF13923_6/7_9e08zfC3HC4_3/PF13920_6/1_7e02zfC3HC4_3/PF13920_6/2_1e07zfRING_5/PF14634_6/3e07zfC3HC4/PF00097_25/1_6e06zfRING_11/PF17123_5/3_2e03zfRING_11/PF17123_5/2_6e06FANCL_C/PF11793_8/0_00015ProkR
MSSADALGIVVEEGETRPQATPAEDRNTTRATYRSAFVLRCLDVALNSSLLIAQQIQFGPTWGDACDYPIKIWATVWISSSTIRAFIMAASGWRLLAGRPLLKPLAILQFLFEVFGFAWFLYGIHCLFVNRPNGEWCNIVSKRWALAGWIFQAICFFLPCALVCLCVPCLLCCLRVPWIRRRLLPLLFTAGPPSTNQTPTPEEILAQLNPTTFRRAVAADALDFDPAEQATSPTAAPPQDDHMAKSLLTSSLPGPFGAVAQMMVRLNSQAEAASGNVSNPVARAATVSRTDQSEAALTAPGHDDLGHGAHHSVPPLKTRHLGVTHTPASQHIELIPESDRALPYQTNSSPAHPLGASSPAVPSSDAALPILTCPICVTEFAGDDEILQLPCDPRRHVFHLSCIQEWLKKSQHCPMCRKNIVELIHQKNAEDEATREGEDPV